MAKLPGRFTMIRRDISIEGFGNVIECRNTKGGEMMVRKDDKGNWRVMTWKLATADQIAKIEAMLVATASEGLTDMAKVAIAKAMEEQAPSELELA